MRKFFMFKHTIKLIVEIIIGVMFTFTFVVLMAAVGGATIGYVIAELINFSSLLQPKLPIY